jgi:RHS repeat-associated protein
VIFYASFSRLRHNRSNYQLAAGNKYKYNGKEQEQMEAWLTLDYGKRFYDPVVARFHTIDPLAENYYPYSPYNYVGGNPIVKIDENGEFWNYVLGGLAGAVTEYVGQVVANAVRDGGFSVENLYKNIDSGDIALSTFEGAATSGGSVIKKAFVKGAVIVGTEVARNAVDVTSEGVEVNSAGEVVKNTAIGLTLGKIGDAAPTPKVKVIDAPTAKQAVKTARAEGNVVTRHDRINIETKAKSNQVKADGANKAAAGAAQKSAAAAAAESTKVIINDDKRK